jgi:hypothetical protein
MKSKQSFGIGPRIPLLRARSRVVSGRSTSPPAFMTLYKQSSTIRDGRPWVLAMSFSIDEYPLIMPLASGISSAKVK